jgi:hypothetical protein
VLDRRGSSTFRIKPIGFCRWYVYINTIVTVLDVIHRPALYVKHDVSCRCFKQRNVNKMYRFVHTSQETYYVSPTSPTVDSTRS